MTQIKNLTPADFRCAIGASCPSLHQLEDGRLLVVGAVGDHEAYLTGAKQSRDEHAILIDPALLDVYVAEKVREERERCAMIAAMHKESALAAMKAGSEEFRWSAIEARAIEDAIRLPPVSEG